MNYRKYQTEKIQPSKLPATKISRNYGQPLPPPPPPAYGSNSLSSRLGKLFTNRQKWPVLVAFGLAFVLGIFGLGFIGLIVGVIVGLFLLTKLSSYRISFKPWQSAVSSLLPLVAKVLFFMVFLLPIADYLTLPSGHSPDTLVKYVSIMIAIPSNFVSGSPTDVFPGIPVVVLISIILMVIGGMNLEKKKTFLIAFAGLLLYTFSPTIASATFGNFSLRFVLEFYAIGFYLAWIGIILILVTKILPRFSNKSNIPPPPPPPVGSTVYSVLPVIFFLAMISQLQSILPSTLISAVPIQLDFETAHHSAASLIAAILGALGAGSAVNQEDEDEGSLTVSLTYPAGRSPNVFTTGWLFGARAILNAGKPDEEDVSDLVKWSGTGSFDPPEGPRSRPTFNNEGPNTITLTVEAKNRADSRSFSVNAISPSGFAAKGDKAKVPADAHGCPACPHTCVGPITSGSPTVLVNGRPAARAGDVGNHAACCGPNSFTIIGLNHDVLIDGKPAAKRGDPTQHCGGQGNIIEGAA